MLCVGVFSACLCVLRCLLSAAQYTAHLEVVVELAGALGDELDQHLDLCPKLIKKQARLFYTHLQQAQAGLFSHYLLAQAIGIP